MYLMNQSSYKLLAFHPIINQKSIKSLIITKRQINKSNFIVKSSGSDEEIQETSKIENEKVLIAT